MPHTPVTPLNRRLADHHPVPVEEVYGYEIAVGDVLVLSHRFTDTRCLEVTYTRWTGSRIHLDVKPDDGVPLHYPVLSVGPRDRRVREVAS